jgi:hypothetical protein
MERRISVSVSQDNKFIANTAARAFGGQPKVTRFWDDAHKRFVDILTCRDRPQTGVISYATIGLSDWPLEMDGKAYEVRAEFVGVCGSSFRSFDNALATAAFCVINSKWFCYPGAIFHDVLKMYEASQTMQHFLFVPPFLWEKDLKTLDFSEKRVAWLLAVPIAEAERQFAEANGSDKLESLFVERQIDIFDLNRASAL